MLPLIWIPKITDPGALIGTLLTAQAAVAALTLAVTLFVMQVVGARRDIDDRTHREYVRRSCVRPIFWSSLTAVGVTGIVLVIENFVAPVDQNSATTHIPRILLLVSASAFFANLIFALILFERAIHQARPDQWWIIRRHVNQRDVHEAVRAYLRHFRRSAAEQAAEIPGQAGWSPDSSEGSANESISALLDDARRAMDERRYKDFTRNLDMIRELVISSAKELENAGITWEAPGSWPRWPPLRELNANLFSFREDVLRRGEEDQVFELQKFDNWLIDFGFSRRCGELFTVGLEGYQQNYEIAKRIGQMGSIGDSRSQLWRFTSSVVSGAMPDEVQPYVEQMVKLQSRFLIDALRVDEPSEYAKLHRGFENFVNSVSERWSRDQQGRLDVAERVRQLQQSYRVALTWIAGRAIMLSDSGGIDDPRPFLNIVREKHVEAEILATDIAKSLEPRSLREVVFWSDLSANVADDDEVTAVYPAKIPLTWFAVRLMEIASNRRIDLNLHGEARRVLSWFSANSKSLAGHVINPLGADIEESRHFAIAALHRAVRRDEIAEDYEIIRYNLSWEKIKALESQVLAVLNEPNSIERLFERADAVLDDPYETGKQPCEQRIHIVVPKGPLADTPVNARIYYEPFDGGEFGRLLLERFMERFCEKLDHAQAIDSELKTPQDLLSKIDEAVESLIPFGGCAVIVAGDWKNLEFELIANESEGFEALWRVPEDDRVGDIGRYMGQPIFRGPSNGDRRAYVVDVPTWGRLVRVEMNGTILPTVEVSAISNERAGELLEEDPSCFANEPDEASRLRKLQTCVEVEIRASRDFDVDDPMRARRIAKVQ